MSLKYLLDENVDPLYGTQLRRLKPDLVIRVIREPVILNLLSIGYLWRQALMQEAIGKRGNK
jgi:hypothetical protein